MDREGAKKLLTILKTAYPSAYRNMEPKEAATVLELYTDIFSGYDEAIVAAALKNYIRVNQYPPTIAGLQEQVDYLIGEDDTAAELWSKVAKACKNGAYGSKEEFEKLPDECKKWLGGASAIRDLSLVAPDMLNTVVRGEFLKSIGQIKDRTEALRMTSPEVLKAIKDAKQKMIGGLNE